MINFTVGSRTTGLTLTAAKMFYVVLYVFHVCVCVCVFRCHACRGLRVRLTFHHMKTSFFCPKCFHLKAFFQHYTSAADLHLHPCFVLPLIAHASIVLLLGIKELHCCLFICTAYLYVIFFFSCMLNVFFQRRGTR